MIVFEILAATVLVFALLWFVIYAAICLFIMRGLSR